MSSKGARGEESQALYQHQVNEANNAPNSAPSTAGVWCRRAAIFIVVAASVSVGIILLAVGRKKGPETAAAADTMPPLFPFVAPGCANPIFCVGPILSAIQLNSVYTDSKTFVDMPIRPPNTPQSVANAFANLSVSQQSDRTALKAFVESYFDPVDAILEAVTPSDYTDAPAFLGNITDPALRPFALDVHRLWRNLTRQYTLQRYCVECTTAIPLTKPFVIPGGRFREFYYWDSLWIVRGLLVSGLVDTARGVIDNFLTLVETYGFVPNGARVYYLDRSQPPILPLVVDTFIAATGGPSTTQNAALLTRALPLLQQEQEFWWTDVNTIAVALPNGTSVRLFRYNTNNTAPRPESYFDDAQMARVAPSAPEFYKNIAAGAETGWDFSTRWLPVGATQLADICTSRVVPVDLNALLLRGSEIISSLASAAGDAALGATFAGRANAQRAAIVAAFEWSNWSDIIVDAQGNAAPRHAYYASIAVAASVKSLASQWNATRRASIAAEIKQRLLVGGLRTSDVNSGQQWDGDNAWPPLQYFAAQAFDHLSLPADAATVAQTYISATYCGFKSSGYMREKYNASALGASGSGGEYIPQVGFGWSNGVLLHFLNQYGASAVAPMC